MDRETVILNLINNFGSYGITRETIEPLVDGGKEEELTYDMIYLLLKAELCNLCGEEFFCTSQDMARAYNLSEEEMNQVIQEARESLIEEGENPDEYFKQVESTKFSW